MRRLKSLSKRSKLLVVGATIAVAILGTAIAVMASGNQSPSRATRTPEQERALSRGLEQAKEIEAKIKADEKTNTEEAEHTPEENQLHHEAEERNKAAEEEQEKASGEERALEEKAEESPGGQATKQYEYENAVPNERE
jgi:hypothetical protein